MNPIYYQLIYPKGYIPGMGYEQIMLGSVYITELRKMALGIEAALWQGAVQLKVTCKVDAFRLCDATGPEKDVTWFCGSM